jgi:DNA polymerase phi
MIRHINIVDTLRVDPWVTSAALPALASLAYSQDDSFQPAVSEKTRNIFRNRLSSAFTHLVSAPDSFLYAYELLKRFEPSAVDMAQEVSATRDRALADIDRITKKATVIEDRRKKPLQAVSLLYGLAIFQLYNGEADAVSLLDELNSCYDVMVRKKGQANSPVLSVALVEILLSFISKPSVLLRKIAQHVVTAFSGEITEEGITALIDVLESSENLKGQQELFDQDDEVNEEVEEDDEDELDSDVEIVDVNRDSVGDESDESEDQGGGDMDDDKEEDDEDDGAAQMLDDALAKALGTHRADQDLNEASSDSYADMSDSEMMALDSKLVEIFSQRKKQPSKKQEKMEARENIVNFKTRVLDLLEIYVKEQSANEAAFKLLLPLLRLMRTTTAKHLSEKAHRVITTFAKASKSVKISEEMQVDVSSRAKILKDIHEEASKDPSHAFARAASTASLLLASTLYRSDKDTVKKIATVYRDTQVKWIKGEWKIQASFFHDWVNWCQSHVS